MEKRIKSLYIVTIIAILAFLAMQAFWLYGRYDFALREHGRTLAQRIIKCVETYNAIREASSKQTAATLGDNDNKNVFSIPSFSLHQQYGDTVKTTRTAKLSTYIFSAYELLGLKPGTPLSDEQKEKAMQLAQANLSTPVDSVVFDASGAKDENEAWNATNNVHTERKNPFTTEGIDSVLNQAGLKATAVIERADSMVWRTSVDYDLSPISPEISMVIPYSQLEGRVVRILCPINPLSVLPGMWQTLIITILVSSLLIVCLLLQFSTVLKLSRLDRMRNSFITTMIHELKRPISTLKMCVSGLENRRMMQDEEIKKELLGETRTALDNLSAYFSKLRDITFNNVEQIPLNLQSLSLHSLFDTVAEALVIPPDKKVVIHNEIDPMLEISADRSHLHNILNNLLENAVKYSADSVEITAHASEIDGVVQLRISDTGNGIAPGDLKHIFNRFYRGKASAGEQPGMGLGLTYVKLLVEAHGGRITAESTEGKGTCFTIKLPQG